MGVITISASFWNMRRRLKAQKQTEKVITDIATAQAAEKSAQAAEKPKKKAGGKNDKSTSRNA